MKAILCNNAIILYTKQKSHGVTFSTYDTKLACTKFWVLKYLDPRFLYWAYSTYSNIEHYTAATKLSCHTASYTNQFGWAMGHPVILLCVSQQEAYSLPTHWLEGLYRTKR